MTAAGPDESVWFDGLADAVAGVLATVGPGEVISYGQIADAAGYPRQARAVGRVLATTEGLAWWRVVNARGRLVPHDRRRQAELLAAEGVACADGHVVDFPT